MSGSFQRFLIERGERVVRVPTRLMASSRRASRQRGKSDRIDALAVARAALARRGPAWRSSPLVFSLVARCQGVYGSRQ